MSENNGIKNNKEACGFVQLENLRAVAIIFVLLCHFSLENDFWRFNGLSDPFFSGVEIFFLVSGYGIAGSILSKPFSWRAFITKRIKRIYPSLFVMLVIAFFINKIMWHMELSEYAIQCFVRSDDVQLADSLRILTGTYILFNHNEYAFGAMWYLSVQMQFYIAIGIIAAVFKDELKRDAIFVVSLFVAIVCMFIRIAILFGYSPNMLIIEYVLGWKMDVPWWGVIIYFLSEYLLNRKFKIHASVFISVLSLVIPVIVLIHTGSAVSSLLGNRLLTGIGYPVCIVFYGILILLCATEQKTFLVINNPLVNWLSSRSYNLFLYNFIGLLFAWGGACYACPWIFYTGSHIHYGVFQIIVGGIFTVLMAEFDYRLINSNFKGL